MEIKKIKKSYKFKLKMTGDLHKYCMINAGHCRSVWNYFCALNLIRLRNKHKIMWYNEMDYWKNNLLKVSEEYKYLNEAFSQSLSHKLKDLDRAFKDAFNKNQPLKRIPKKKKKLNKNDSFRIPFPNNCILRGNTLKLPVGKALKLSKKTLWVKFFKSRTIEGTPKNVTISRDGDDWYISIQCEQTIHIEESTKKDIGIDVGVKTFATGAYLSRGKYQFLEKESKNYGKKYQDRKANLQRILALKKKFSNNWRKLKDKISKIDRKIKNCRHDYLHKTSTEICKNHARIFVENLKIKNMTKSSKGTVENPGKNVSQKSGLNKSILDQGWGMFREMLKYKAKWNGGELVKRDPKHTSQTCHQCGYIDKENRKTQELFECLKCQIKINADRNAAINILTLGQRGIACQVKIQ